MSYLGTLSLVLITTALAGHFSRRVGMPAVIGELLVGIVLGPAVLGLVTNNSFVHTFSEIGVIILMFIAGLESDLELLKKYLKPAFSVAVCGVIVPVGLVFLFGKLFSFSNEQAIFLGVTFAATSVSISVEVLKELHFLDSKEGTTILGASSATLQPNRAGTSSRTSGFRWCFRHCILQESICCSNTLLRSSWASQKNSRFRLQWF